MNYFAVKQIYINFLFYERGSLFISHLLRYMKKNSH
jgi:hypothetical protein